MSTQDVQLPSHQKFGIFSKLFNRNSTSTNTSSSSGSSPIIPVAQLVSDHERNNRQLSFIIDGYSSDITKRNNNHLMHQNTKATSATSHHQHQHHHSYHLNSMNSSSSSHFHHRENNSIAPIHTTSNRTTNCSKCVGSCSCSHPNQQQQQLSNTTSSRHNNNNETRVSMVSPLLLREENRNPLYEQLGSITHIERITPILMETTTTTTTTRLTPFLMDTPVEQQQSTSTPMMLTSLLMDTPPPTSMDTPKYNLPFPSTANSSNTTNTRSTCLNGIQGKMPSPYDIHADRPNLVDRMEDISTLREALLESPLDFHQNNVNANNKPAGLDARMPMNHEKEDEITSLCRAFALAQKMFKGPSVIPETSTSTSSTLSKNPVLPLAAPPPVVKEEKNINTAKAKYQRKTCSAVGCKNLSRSHGRCKAHGGGKRCSYAGCTRASQTGSLCISHGGGKRCTVEGCIRAAQSRGKCKGHGGGVRCCVEGCEKSSQGNGSCRIHGGGKRCSELNCTKWAQRAGKCMVHSGGKYGNSYRGRQQRMIENVQQTSSAPTTAK